MTKTIGDYIILLISIAGSFASIIAFGVYFSPSLNDQGWVGVAFLGILSVFFLSYNFYLISTYRKKVKYADIYQDINIGFSQLHSISREEDQSIELIIRSLSSLCDNLSQAFTKIYGTKIGVCIKFLTSEKDRPLVQTLVRDNNSKTNERKTGTNDEIKHWLDGNSDFDFIYSNFDNDNIDTTYYHEKNLPICKDYRNTRIQNTWVPKQKFIFLENFMRRKYWPLKYRSTLVVPIVPILADQQNKNAIRGFLCIDSPQERLFNKDIDVCILKGISDGLYNQIDKLLQLIKNNG